MYRLEDGDPSSWISQNLLGGSEFSRAFASNYSNIVRTHYGVNDRFIKGWMINPGHYWPQGGFALSDRMIAIAVLTLKTSTGRRLLVDTITRDVQFKQGLAALAQTPGTTVMPPMSLNQDIFTQAGRAMGLKEYIMVNVSVAALFKSDMTDRDVQLEIERRLRVNLGSFCPSCNSVSTAFYNVDPVKWTSGRRLLQTSGAQDTERTGSIVIVLTYTNGTESGGKIYGGAIAQAIADFAYAGEAADPNQLTPGEVAALDVTKVGGPGSLIASAIAPGITWDGKYPKYYISTPAPGATPLKSAAALDAAPSDMWFRALLFVVATAFMY